MARTLFSGAKHLWPLGYCISVPSTSVPFTPRFCLQSLPSFLNSLLPPFHELPPLSQQNHLCVFRSKIIFYPLWPSLLTLRCLPSFSIAKFCEEGLCFLFFLCVLSLGDFISVHGFAQHLSPVVASPCSLLLRFHDTSNLMCLR